MQTSSLSIVCKIKLARLYSATGIQPHLNPSQEGFGLNRVRIGNISSNSSLEIY